nr:MAG: hypothetical protein [uncultured archaeon]
MTDKEVKTIRTKALYILKDVIIFTIIFSIVKGFLIDLNPETFIQNWEIGLLGIAIFSTLYVLDLRNKWYLLFFKYDIFNEFMISFFLSYLLTDFDDFFLIFMNIL